MEDPKRSRSASRKAAVFILVFILIVTVLAQLWAVENRSEFFSIKARIHGSYTGFTNFSFLRGINASLKSENDRLADQLRSLQKKLDAAAKCLNPEKMELTASNVACLREIFSGIVAAAPASCQDELQKDKIEALKREMEVMADHLRQSVELFPLKDANVAPMTEPDRTWFMSTLRGKGENGNPEKYYFPSEVSNGKILCIKGRHLYDGALNSYGFAWPRYLPSNSTLLPGLTFIADNFWDYNNPWHSMTTLVVSAAWRMENQCKGPQRFLLFQNGALVKTMGSWISSVLQAAMDGDIKPDQLEYGDGAVCFEKAVVYRRGLERMSLEKRLALFDMIRCKARKMCNISDSRRIVDGIRTINLTLVARTGPRSFKNESLVASVVAEECKKVPGCHFRLLHIGNLSFCQQVEAMSRTDIMATVHGAQLTNMMFMSKGSSVMEMFPKAWLEGAGVGQYIYHWFASWSGMNHEGTYRDSEGPDCPNPDPVQCFLFYKDRQVGHNQTYLAHWTAGVLTKFQNRTSSLQELKPSTCACD